MKNRYESLPKGNAKPRTKLALLAKQKFTAAEKLLDDALKEHDSGFFNRRYEREWVLERKWRLDFFFYESRIGVEVDGEYHMGEEQIKKDKLKENACKRCDVILLRFKNDEIFNDIAKVIIKIRNYHDFRLLK